MPSLVSVTIAAVALAMLAGPQPSAFADKSDGKSESKPDKSEKKTQGMSHPRSKPGAARGGPAIQKARFGKVDGKPVDLYTLINSMGMVAKITNYGAIVTRAAGPRPQRRDGRRRARLQQRP